MTDPMELVGRMENIATGSFPYVASAAAEAAACIRELVEKREGMALVPRTATEEMLMAARGLIMSMSFNVPNYGTTLGAVADSGFYGEHWAHILTEEERLIKAPLTKGHRADLIWRAMVSAALPPAPGEEA